jgi:hypothetical protein
VIARLALAPREALSAGAAVLLALLALWPWARWALHTPEQLPEIAPVVSSAPAALAALETFADIAQRPLFTPGRRPSPATPVAAPQGLRLEGVIVMGAEKRAIIKQADGRTARLGEGDTIGEWTVRRIDPDHVLLVAGDRRLDLTPRRARAR